jgi:hypothetical protein
MLRELVRVLLVLVVADGTGRAGDHRGRRCGAHQGGASSSHHGSVSFVCSGCQADLAAM